VWRSTSAIHLSGLAQIEKGIDSLTKADTDNRLTDDLTYLLTILLFFLVKKQDNKCNKRDKLKNNNKLTNLMVPEGLALVLNFLEIPASSWHSRTTVSKTVSPDGIPPAT